MGRNEAINEEEEGAEELNKNFHENNCGDELFGNKSWAGAQ